MVSERVCERKAKRFFIREFSSMDFRIENLVVTRHGKITTTSSDCANLSFSLHHLKWENGSGWRRRKRQLCKVQQLSFPFSALMMSSRLRILMLLTNKFAYDLSMSRVSSIKWAIDWFKPKTSQARECLKFQICPNKISGWFGLCFSLVFMQKERRSRNGRKGKNKVSLSIKLTRTQTDREEVGKLLDCTSIYTLEKSWKRIFAMQCNTAANAYEEDNIVDDDNDEVCAALKTVHCNAMQNWRRHRRCVKLSIIIFSMQRVESCRVLNSYSTQFWKFLQTQQWLWTTSRLWARRDCIWARSSKSDEILLLLISFLEKEEAQQAHTIEVSWRIFINFFSATWVSDFTSLLVLLLFHYHTRLGRHTRKKRLHSDGEMEYLLLSSEAAELEAAVAAAAACTTNMDFFCDSTSLFLSFSCFIYIK